MTFTNLQRKISNNSLLDLISPPKQDPFMQELSVYDENNFSDVFLNGYPSMKKKDSFLSE